MYKISMEDIRQSHDLRCKLRTSQDIQDKSPHQPTLVASNSSFGICMVLYHIC